MIRKLKTQQLDFGNIKPKKVEINGVEVNQEENGNWNHYYTEEMTYNIDWKTNSRIMMAPQTGAGGGAGGAGGKSIAITRLNLIDPHLVLMMRDVMSSSAIPQPLNVAPAGGGGGGGGGVGASGESATAGEQPTALTTPRCVVINDAANGGAGSAGKGYEGPPENVYNSGAGGGGAGGNGGAIVIITTSDSAGTLNTNNPDDNGNAGTSNGNISVMGGPGGNGGNGTVGATAQVDPGDTGQGGHQGRLVFIQI